MTDTTAGCRCGHSMLAHDHWRAGGDCGICDTCPGYKPRLGDRLRAWQGRLRDTWQRGTHRARRGIPAPDPDPRWCPGCGRHIRDCVIYPCQHRQNVR